MNRFLLALAGLPLLAAACGGSTTTSTTTTVSIPSGWKTYTYGRMAIAAPGNWVVRHDTDCPNAAPAGALLLGSTSEPSSCIPIEIPGGVVKVDQLPSEANSATVPVAQKPVVINGLPVYLGFGSPIMVQWIVPALVSSVGSVRPTVSSK